MKRKTLLLLLGVMVSILSIYSQDTIKTLIFSEVRMDEKWNAYVELTNVGEDTLDLSRFSVCGLSQWHTGYDAPANREAYLPAVKLAPGNSYVVACVFNMLDILSKEQPNRFIPYTKPEMYDVFDLPIHCLETEIIQGEDDSRDSVSVYYDALYSFSGQGAFFIEYHSDTDSMAVDEVNLVLSNNQPVTIPRDVAGVTNATANSILVRKASVKEGNMDWEASRGLDLTDSEWIPIPRLQNTNQEYDRSVFWTVGNHGDYKLNETTFVPKSSDVAINWTNSTITVPYGMRNNDSVMYHFVKAPGIAWHYTFSPEKEDSMYVSARTGDVLTVYACGNELQQADFTMIVQEPGPGANIVMPLNRMDFETGEYIAVRGNPFEVTDGVAGMDTIYDVPYGTRIDTLLKYLDKPPLASWEVILLNDEKRSDLVSGDKLKVTAENGNVKEYYIKTDPFYPGRNVFLSSITWPDIPDYYRDLFGWKGDTIPNFAPATTQYNVNIPFDVTGIPAFVARAQDLNTKIEMERAKSLTGSEQDRTVTIKTTAELDTLKKEYNILLTKEKDPANIQPWKAEPFISQYSWRSQEPPAWHWNSAWEFMNPGTEPIDMSNYMFVKGIGTPAEVIQSAQDWDSRMNKYIFGYQWVDSADWSVSPGSFEKDLRVNTIVNGGDVFVLASAGFTTRNEQEDWYPYHWNEESFDVNFRNVDNPWHVAANVATGNCVDHFNNQQTFWLFRIDNDSIKNGKKPANDPNDFTLIDVFGTGDGSGWAFMNDNGINPPYLASDHKRVTFRKPEIYEGNPVPGASFDTAYAENSEWYSYKAPNDLNPLGYTWPWNNWMVMGWLGSHTMNEVTIYRSTVTSNVYLVSPGYSMNETIRGVTTGTTVEQFLNNIIQVDENQKLTLMSGGTEIAGSTALTDGDALQVVSADSSNTSKYILEVTDEGLRDNAILTSTEYTIEVTEATGKVSGFDYGATVEQVLANIVVPPGASLTVIDGKGAYVPLKQLNYDTLYVETRANNGIYFEVVAEDGQTTIVYQLIPNMPENDVSVTSNVYDVSEDDLLISLVPTGVNVPVFFSNLVPSPGASIRIVDKYGFERTDGTVRLDDKLVVSSEDGNITKVYYLSFLNYEFAINVYAAYVLSNVYAVDQLSLNISGESHEAVTVQNFLNNLVPSAGASLSVLDDLGNDKASTDPIEEGDVVRVIASDGANQVIYSVNMVYTSIASGKADHLSIYPNPTDGRFVIENCSAGSTIRIYNALGVIVRDAVSGSARETVSIENEPAGIYFVIVENRSAGSSHTFKIMKVQR